MLPATIAPDIRNQVLHYLAATFNFREKSEEEALRRFFEDPEQGLFKGPWVQVRRPFRLADEDAEIPFDIVPSFHPFKHQWKAWQRLSSRGRDPLSTLVTTGTGSGKTECFLYPILDHCLRARKQGQKGIKAIILYPMNALANDQAKRFAVAISDDPTLVGAGIRAGLYTGRYDPANPGAPDANVKKAMGPDFSITDHATLQDNPPDVLLTNYKMLDFLLMRPQDQKLWRMNEPGALRYLVLDELHTYDGAQGSDVACLIRRLKERLGIPKGSLCAVGTSATIAGEDGLERLGKFAWHLFEEDIPIEAMIDEDRLEVEEIVDAEVDDGTAPLPPPGDCMPRDGETALRFAQRQAELWGGPVYVPPEPPEPASVKEALTRWGVTLGDWLRHNSLFKLLLESTATGLTTWRELVERLARGDFRLAALKAEEREAVITAFLALIAQARELRSGRAFPLAPTQVQLWIRELRRLGRVVSEATCFSWLDEPAPGTRVLPGFHCAECGESGWVALHDPDQDSLIQGKGVQGIQLTDDAQKIYRAWGFGRQARSQRIVVLSPWRADAEEEGSGSIQQTLALDHDYICPGSLVLRKGNGPCALTGAPTFRVRVDRRTKTVPNTNRVVGDQRCPRCGSDGSLFFIGSQAATIASVAIDEVFGSILNSDPKLLAFTDSVQDASHRAGFFSARTYHFTFRTALQHLVDDCAEEGLPVLDAGARLLEYWSRPEPGRPGSLRETLGTLMPPDLRDYTPYVKYREAPGVQDPPERLRKELAERLAWEAVSEFGLMLTHGRTMERSGSSCLGWDEGAVNRTVECVREALPRIDPSLLDLDDRKLRVWLYGLLYRHRERGALVHEYLNSYARNGFWGKFPFGRAIAGREAHPPAGHYRPRLLVTGPDRFHDHLLAPTRQGGNPSWHVRWARRALGLPSLDEVSLLDLLGKLLECGEKTGLFRCLHQDGPKRFYALDSRCARLFTDGETLACSETGQVLVRPAGEATLWEGAPSMGYYAEKGTYRRTGLSDRQRYYRQRYRKGALRRVFAMEHTGLLTTEERESLEKRFIENGHADDPNVITCTSTLEMGIDIGDLSTTMLCSIPPSTASYVQRIGRAGRSTGTALVISLVNQRPHDLFFYARPEEMLKGRVDPPGCWLDASAVLVRQYLGYCFDRAVKEQVLKVLPRSGRELCDDLDNHSGPISAMLDWVTKNEDALRADFLGRFQEDILPDTRERFIGDTATELLQQRVHKAARDFDSQRKDLENARKRLAEQLKDMNPEEDADAIREVEQERRILRGRIASLNRTRPLEILIDHGLLPNYAFPERGVRFYGAVYKKLRSDEDEKPKTIEVIRGAGIAIRELAPANKFYTRSRAFDIQQISIGHPNQSLIEEWAVCGECGHMRLTEVLHRPETLPACPQCGHDGTDTAQTDRGQQRRFIEFVQSQALSYMEHYESLSGDKAEERERQYYEILNSFDLTTDAPSGAVGEDSLPFGIEYRAALVLRQVNVGYGDQPPGAGTIPFGPGVTAPDLGFQVCRDCGVVASPNELLTAVEHRRSCRARRQTEKMRREGKQGDAYRWESLYLYRQLKSEAIRLLLPFTDEEDIATLTACIYLGLRLRFEGDPAHLLVERQTLPQAEDGLRREYLVLMDAVPGGTGYLKALYQEKDPLGRMGEGLVDVLRRARDTLETCVCRKLSGTKEDTDGCYRCIRTYHLQFKADLIGRERGIRLLNRLIEAAERREEKKTLDHISVKALFGSVLEKKVMEALRAHAEGRQGTWEETIVKGARGFRFTLPGEARIWELELQPKLGLAQGVMVQSQPDFLLSSDDGKVKPLAVFADGFEPHCRPGETPSRLADDMVKRRAILESGNYHLWNLTWEDLQAAGADHVMTVQPFIAQILEAKENSARQNGQIVPKARQVVRNGMEQLKAFLACPHAPGWSSLAHFALYFPLSKLSGVGDQGVVLPDLKAAMESWSNGSGMPAVAKSESGDWLYTDRAGLAPDLVTYMSLADILNNAQHKLMALLRLGDREEERSGSDYKERWRRFLCCLNLFQFCSDLRFWVTSEMTAGTAPDLPTMAAGALPPDWQDLRDNVTTLLRPYIAELALADVALPVLEHYHDDIGDDVFAELAWPELPTPLAVLAGDQASFAAKWQKLGWRVVVPGDIQAKGVCWLIDLIQAPNGTSGGES